MKKRHLLLLLVSCLTLLGACGKNSQAQSILDKIQSSQTPHIRWGIKNDTRLFGYYNIAKQEVEGFDIDIAKALTKEIAGPQAQADFVEVTSKTRIPLLKNGNIDAIIATMTISEERKKQVDFTDVYFAAGQSLLGPEDSPLQPVQDLGPQNTVLAVKGSSSAESIRQFAPQAKVLELENYAEAFTALQSGQGDVMTTDNAILLGIADQNPGYRLIGEAFTKEPYGIAVDKSQKDFRDEVNRALVKIKADGTYDKIFHKWFPDAGESANAKNLKEA